MSQLRKHSVFLELEEAKSFKAKSSFGYTFCVDGFNDDNGQGVSPMELLIIGTGGCSGVDIISILKSDSEKLVSFTIQVAGERNMSETPAYFRSIHLNYQVKGNVNLDKLVRAIQLSLEKYCTVGKTLEAFAKITWNLNLNGENYSPTELSKKR